MLSRSALPMSTLFDFGGSKLLMGSSRKRGRRAKLFAGFARAADRGGRLLADAERVGRFLAGYSAFEPRESDIWIATYPRSGTTWSQYLLVLLHRGVDFEFEHIHDPSPWFERSLAVGSLRAEDFNALASPRIFKTHLPASWVPERGRVLHVHRDGRDVARSYFGLYRKYLGFQGSFSEFFDRFLNGDLQYRSWFDFERGWQVRKQERNVLSVAYEEMRANPRNYAERIAKFMGLSPSAQELDAIVAATDIKSMKEIEHKFDHAALLLRERGVQSQSFIRDGRVGAGAKELTPEQERAFQETRARTQSAPARAELRIASFLE